LLDRSLILELIPAAALVYRRTDDKILSANRKFYDLTAFTADTLKEISLYTLIPGDPDTNPTGDQSRPVRLQIASGDLILATMRILSISLTNQVVVLTFSPPDSEFEIRRDLLEQEYRFDNFSLFNHAGQPKFLASSFPDRKPNSSADAQSKADHLLPCQPPR